MPKGRTNSEFVLHGGGITRESSAFPGKKSKTDELTIVADTSRCRQPKEQILDFCRKKQYNEQINPVKDYDVHGRRCAKG